MDMFLKTLTKIASKCLTYSLVVGACMMLAMLLKDTVNLIKIGLVRSDVVVKAVGLSKRDRSSRSSVECVQETFSVESKWTSTNSLRRQRALG
jgi:hypothetical protein